MRKLNEKSAALLTVILLLVLILTSCSLFNTSPTKPESPSPADGAVDVIPEDVILSWQCSDPDGDELIYTLVFGDSTDNLNVIADPVYGTNYSLGYLEDHKTYYWKVIARDAKGGETEGSESYTAM